MSKPSVPESNRAGKAPADVRARILAEAKPFPEVPEDEMIEMTEDEARVFWDAILNA